MPKPKIKSPDAEELRMARWILQKHSTVLVAEGADVTKTLDAIDRLTAPFKPSPKRI